MREVLSPQVVQRLRARHAHPCRRYRIGEEVPVRPVWPQQQLPLDRGHVIREYRMVHRSTVEADGQSPLRVGAASVSTVAVADPAAIADISHRNLGALSELVRPAEVRCLPTERSQCPRTIIRR